MHGERLGRYLLEQGSITAAQLEEAQRTRGFFGGSLDEHLVQLGYVNEAVLGGALSEIDGAPFADRERLRSIPEAALARISRDFADRLRVCPFEIDRGTLKVAMLNTRNAVAIAELRSHSGLDIEPWVTSPHGLDAALARHYRIRSEGVRGLRVGATPGPEAATKPRDDPEESVATDPSDSPTVGLDGLPLDAELSVDDQIFFSRKPQASRARPPLPSAEPHDAVEQPVPRTSHLEKLEDALLAAVDRDAIANAVIEFGSSRAHRCALFAVGREGIRFIAGRGRGFDAVRLARVTIPRDGDSVLDSLLDGSEFYLGAVPPLPANRDLFSALGGKLPPMVMLLPIRLRGRIVAILYLDDDTDVLERPDVPLMRRVVDKAGLAFEILLLRNKLGGL